MDILDISYWNRGASGDGVALQSAAHPMGSGPIPPSRLSSSSLERIEIEVPLPANCPEIAYACSGAEFNDQFGPAAVVALARGGDDAVGAAQDH